MVARAARLLMLMFPLSLIGMLPGCSPSSNLQAAGPSTAADDPEYVIGSGDVLDVFVYHAPELSDAHVPVRPDGRISIPLVQDIPAAGKTPKQLASDIDARLKQYVQNPNVTVMVQSFVGPLGTQIKVIGQATDPTAIPYRDGLTLLDVMVATKGLTKFAAGNRAIIIRHEPDGKEKTIHVRLSDLINDGDISQNIKMHPGDTLIIPETWF